MQSLIFVLLWLAPVSLLLAQPWQFEHGVDVAGVGSGMTHKLFHHLDNEGNLHFGWVERDKIGGTTRLKYAFGKLQTAD